MKTNMIKFDNNRYVLQSIQLSEEARPQRGGISLPAVRELSRHHGNKTKMVATENHLDRSKFDKHSRAVNVSKELLWGCYKYKKGSLGVSREKADEISFTKMECSRSLPEAWIIGVKKCGSQMLTGLLDLHPEIVSSIYLERTDNMFLNKAQFVNKYSPWTSPKEMGLFDMVGLQNKPDVLRHVVHNLSTPNTLFILILIDPVKRALSDYVHCKIKMQSTKNIGSYLKERRLVWDGKSQKTSYDMVSLFKGYKIASTFEKSVFNLSGKPDIENGLIKKGLYFNYANAVLKLIPRDKLLVIDGQKFVTHPWEVLSTTESFLNVSNFFTPQHFRKEGKYYCPSLEERPDAGCVNGKGRKKPKVSPKVVRKLETFFRPYNRKLQSLVDEHFVWMH
ncbi:Heparan sulfate glucosamine 3-O-sulfotransferase 1 [Holothuria leucospilota]|uniref:Heparan sulfate glucosamine 3-O-sulfotransferase 1 n=1 Tax=Holothuria leucospilota TaxID=206669 RepID=A0A9Q1BRT2_HOLLE|nr:Heparan sulfate glucosamine 3-O-sulfotransferase 1 [Holothuria leucospilota]